MAGIALGLTVAVARDDRGELDLSGKWSVTTACNPRACGIQAWEASETIKIRHKGSEVTIRSSAVGKIKAEVQGRVVTWSRTYSEEGGKTVETGSVEVSEDGRSFEGPSRWFWTDGQTSCRGSCEYTGEKRE